MPTPEERERTIKIARQMIANQLELLNIGGYRDDVNALVEQFAKQRATPEPVEDPQEQEKLNAVLAAAKAQRGQASE